MDNNSTRQILIIALMFLIILLFILLIAYIVIKVKNKVDSKNTSSKTTDNDNEVNGKKQKDLVSYNKKSVFDFMEFDDIEDNMIIQKNGRRYIAVVECVGVNYDLMSSMEKNAVEEGFQQFLNTLRHPIQLYIQTRTMNLEKSIEGYKSRVKEIEERYNKVSREYAQMKSSLAYSQEDLNKQLFEVTRCRNLLEYGKDIIANTERMSLNKNVLTKKYYIVMSYYPEDVDKFDNEEIKSMAFSELYTRGQAMLSTLAASSITGKILNSQELVELLYMAYNREEADTYGLEKALKAGYDSLYSTAPDVFEKKIKFLNEEINRQALELANRKIEEAKSKVQQKAESKEANMTELIRQMAQIVIKDNTNYVGEEVANEALDSLKEEGGKTNVGKEKETRRRKKQ